MSATDVRGLLAFAKVVESRSFSSAAAQLGVTKSAVSKLVASTEAALGAQLLVRTTRKLALTDAGEAVYAACTHLERDLEAVRQAAARHGSVVGHLRVTAPAVLGREQLIPLAAQFLERHPQVSMDIVLSDDFVDLMAQHVDVALRVRRSFSESSLVVRRITSVPIVICGSPAYLERRGTPKHPEDLTRHEFITHAPNAQANRLTFARRGKRVSVKVKSRLGCNDGAATVAAAVASLGLVMAPDFEVSEAVARGKLALVLTGWEMDRLSLSALFPQQRLIPTKVRAFVSFVAERWKKPPWTL